MSAEKSPSLSGAQTIVDVHTGDAVTGVDVTAWGTSGSRLQLETVGNGFDLGSFEAKTLVFSGNPDYVRTIELVGDVNAGTPERAIISNVALGVAMSNANVALGANDGAVASAACAVNQENGALLGVSGLVVQLEQSGAPAAGAKVFYLDPVTRLPDTTLQATSSTGEFSAVAAAGVYDLVAYGITKPGEAPRVIGRVDQVAVEAGSVTSVAIHPVAMEATVPGK